MARRIGILVVMVVGVALLVWAGIHNHARRQAAMQQAQQKQITVARGDYGPGGAADESVPDLGGVNMRGKSAPAFTLTSLNGKKVSLADFKGKPVVVNFWGTYCGPCKIEMPWFEEFSKKYAGQQLVVLGIDDEDGVSKADVEKAAQHIGVTYPILLADGKVSTAYGLGDYLPVTFYLDTKGDVVEQTTGAPSKDAMESYIRKILPPASGM